MLLISKFLVTATPTAVAATWLPYLSTMHYRGANFQLQGNLAATTRQYEVALPRIVALKQDHKPLQHTAIKIIVVNIFYHQEKYFPFLL